MRLGICCGPDEAPAFLEAGFDYVELSAQLLRARDPSYSVPENLPRSWETSNLFFPGDMTLYGSEEWRDYAALLFERAAKIPLALMVVGSGGVRRAPETMSPDEGLKHFLSVVTELQSMASPRGITVAPEALRREETNVGADTPALALALQGRCGWTLDLYHAYVEGTRERGKPKDWQDFWTAQIPRRPDHVHASAMDRTAPLWPDAPLLAALDRLSELGYAGRVSLECSRGEQSPQQIHDNMRRFLDSARG